MSHETVVVKKTELVALAEKLYQLSKGQNSIKVVDESTFVFHYDNEQDPQLGLIQIASKAGNEIKFIEAFKILIKAEATRSNQYHGPNYNCSYWIEKGNIYRQKLKK